MHTILTEAHYRLFIAPFFHSQGTVEFYILSIFYFNYESKGIKRHLEHLIQD